MGQTVLTRRTFVRRAVMAGAAFTFGLSTPAKASTIAPASTYGTASYDSAVYGSNLQHRRRRH